MFNWFKRKAKKESDVGGSNPSTPAKPKFAIYKKTDALGRALLGDYRHIRIRCTRCLKMTGIISNMCWEERDSGNRVAAAYRVGCTQCGEIFRVVFNPLICLSCSDPCNATSTWDRWEDDE
jgi:hypothetical protein